MCSSDLDRQLPGCGLHGGGLRGLLQYPHRPARRRPVEPVSGVTGRFAPSPSGRLHLGNLACSLLAWLSAKSQGGRILLRIEDLDAARCPRIYADLLEQDLRFLGLDWDEGGSLGGPHGPYYQSHVPKARPYTRAFPTLISSKLPALVIHRRL